LPNSTQAALIQAFSIPEALTKRSGKIDLHLAFQKWLGIEKINSELPQMIADNRWTKPVSGFLCFQYNIIINHLIDA